MGGEDGFNDIIAVNERGFEKVPPAASNPETLVSDGAD